MFIDDVSFKQAAECASDCAPDLGTTSVGTLPTLMIADGYCPGALYCAECSDRYTGACEPPCNEFESGAVDCHCCPVQFFQLIVRNAIGVNFWVYARNNHGVIHYEQHSFDANGLTFAEQDYFVLQWMGRTMGGQHLPAGIYDYELEIWNCDPGSQRTYAGYFYYEVGSQYFAQPPNHVNGLLDTEDCCPYSKYFQNFTFNGVVNEGAESFITAGYAVTSGTPGFVVVPITADVTFRAGDAINLEPGFLVQPGGNFEALITDCAYSPKSRPYAPPQYAFVHMAPYDRPTSETISVYPNPTRERATVAMPKEFEGATIVVRDGLGRPLLTRISSNVNEMIDFTGLAKGMYIVEVLKGGSFYQSVCVSYD